MKSWVSRKPLFWFLPKGVRNKKWCLHPHWHWVFGRGKEVSYDFSSFERRNKSIITVRDSNSPLSKMNRVSWQETNPWTLIDILEHSSQGCRKHLLFKGTWTLSGAQGSSCGSQGEAKGKRKRASGPSLSHCLQSMVFPVQTSLFQIPL